MRELNTFQSYLDEIGRPLVGRVRFCGADGTTPSNVYDKDGKSLNNVVFTDNAGRLKKQVFLDDHDYTLYFDKYIGAGTMREDAADDAWKPVGSAVNTYDTFSIKIDTEGIQCVKNVQELISLIPDVVAETEGARVVGLLGYNDAGDKPVVYYRWDENVPSSRIDGGKYIGVTSRPKGAWVLVDNGESVDVRDFGAFPRASVVRDSDMNYRIQKAMSYANFCGKKLLFVADDVDCFYDVTELHNLNKVVCDGEAKLFCCTNMAATANNVETIHVYSDNNVAAGEFNVYGDTLRTSFNTEGNSSVKLHPNYRLIVDKDIPCDFSEVDVVLETNLTFTSTFTRCRFMGSSRIGGEYGGARQTYTFNYCEIKGNSLNYKASNVSAFYFNNCTTTEVEWDDIDSYIDFCASNESYDIDCAQRQLSRVHELSHDCHLMNISSAKSFVIDGVNVIAEQCTLNNLELKANTSITAKFCTFTIMSDSFPISVNFSNCTLRDREAKTNGWTILSGEIRNCRIEAGIRVNNNTSVIDCTFSKNAPHLYSQDVHDGYWTLYSGISFTGCVFAEGLSPTIVKNGTLTYANVDNLLIKGCRFEGTDYKIPIALDNGVSMVKNVGRYVITDNVMSSFDTEKRTLSLTGVTAYGYGQHPPQPEASYIQYIEGSGWTGKNFSLSQFMNLFGEDENEVFDDFDMIDVDITFSADYYGTTGLPRFLLKWNYSSYATTIAKGELMSGVAANEQSKIDDPTGNLYVKITRTPRVAYDNTKHNFIQ